MVKGTYVDKNGLRKGAWTEEEDDKLRAYVERYGHWNWRLLPQFAGLDRCGKSCRLRWMNYLKPGIKRGGFTQEERDLIAKLHLQHGNKWSAISAKLPGRTDHGIKNYWHAHHRNRKNTTSRSSGNEAEAEIPELPEGFSGSNVVTSAATKLGSRKHIKTRISSADVFVLESSESNSAVAPAAIESGSDSSTQQNADSLSDLLVSEFHDSFWTQPFMVETDTFQGYHDYDFRVCDEEGAAFSPLFDIDLCQ